MHTPWVLPLLIIVWFGAPESVLCDDVTVTLLLDDKLVNITLPEDAVPALGTFLDQIITITQPNSSYEILACKSPDLMQCPENSSCIEIAANSSNFDCLCEAGWIYHENECIEDPCYENGKETCENTQICNITSGTCICADGFVEFNGTCILNTPCFQHKCPAHSICEKFNDTSYTCKCNGNGGYEKTGGDDDETLVCTDVDECTLETAKCSQYADCQNTDGSYTCTCKTGFIGDGKTCNDTDECQDGNDSCNINAVCINTQGSYNCTCMVGYAGNGRDCTDMDECADNNGGCHEHAICQNTDGSFSCSCKPGFNGDGKNCSDIDECDESHVPKVCDARKTCKNEFGSYRCDTLSGIVINGVTTGTNSAERRRRRRDTATDIENALEQYFSNVLSTNVDFTVTATEPLTLALDIDPSFLNSVQLLLANLGGMTLGGVKIDSATYPTDVYFFGKVNLPGRTEDEACLEIKEHIDNSEDGVTTTCDGTFDGDEFSFNVKVEGARSDFDIGSVLSTFGLEVTKDPCVCDDDKTDCTFVNGRPQCNCKNSYHDANFAEPGTECVNPIANVTCREDEIGASLYANYFYRIGLDPESLHLLDTDCSGTVDGSMLKFNSSATDCGTITNHTGDNVQYANAVTNILYPEGTYKANPAVRFDFTCSYPKNFTTNPDEEDPTPINLVTTTVITQNAQGTGELSVSITIYHDDEFETALRVNDSVTSGDKLYVLATHSATLSPNYLKIISCHATPTKEPNDESQTSLISNSCPNGVLVSGLKSGVHENASFELTAISFPNSNELYIHCDVELCNELCSETCPARKKRRRRDTAGVPKLSVGPVNMIDETSPGNPETSSSSSNVNAGSVVAGICGCLAVVAVVAFIVVKRKRSNRRSSKYDDTNVPSASYYNTGFSSQTTEYADCPSRISRRN